MIKASNETYIFGVVFRDALQNASDPQSTVIHTWKYAFVFDDKQRLYYEPEIEQIPAVLVTSSVVITYLRLHLTTIQVVTQLYKLDILYKVDHQEHRVKFKAINFTGPVASPYSTGDVTILVTSGVNDVFQDAEKVFYDAVIS